VVGIAAVSREVPGRNVCDRRHTYRVIIIIIIYSTTGKAEGSITHFLPALIAASRLHPPPQKKRNTEFEISQMYPVLNVAKSAQDLWAVQKKESL